MSDGKDELTQDGDSRRALLRKAAVAPIVAGAVWAAPRIEGLSVVPDVAAAASGSSLNGPFTIPVPGEGLNFVTNSGTSQVSSLEVLVNPSPPGYPVSVQLFLNLAGGCVFGDVNAVDSNQGPMTILNESGSGNTAITADLQFITDVAFDVTSVSFDLLCT